MSPRRTVVNPHEATRSSSGSGGGTPDPGAGDDYGGVHEDDVPEGGSGTPDPGAGDDYGGVHEDDVSDSDTTTEPSGGTNPGGAGSGSGASGGGSGGSGGSRGGSGGGSGGSGGSRGGSGGGSSGSRGGSRSGGGRSPRRSTPDPVVTHEYGYKVTRTTNPNGTVTVSKTKGGYDWRQDPQAGVGDSRIRRLVEKDRQERRERLGRGMALSGDIKNDRDQAIFDQALDRMNVQDRFETFGDVQDRLHSRLGDLPDAPEDRAAALDEIGREADFAADLYGSWSFDLEGGGTLDAGDQLRDLANDVGYLEERATIRDALDEASQEEDPDRRAEAYQTILKRIANAQETHGKVTWGQGENAFSASTDLKNLERTTGFLGEYAGLQARADRKFDDPQAQADFFTADFATSVDQARERFGDLTLTGTDGQPVTAGELLDQLTHYGSQQADAGQAGHRANTIDQQVEAINAPLQGLGDSPTLDEALNSSGTALAQVNQGLQAVEADPALGDTVLVIPGEDGEPDRQVTYRDYLTELKGTLEETTGFLGEYAGLQAQANRKFDDPQAQADFFTADFSTSVNQARERFGNLTLTGADGQPVTAGELLDQLTNYGAQQADAGQAGHRANTIDQQVAAINAPLQVLGDSPTLDEALNSSGTTLAQVNHGLQAVEADPVLGDTVVTIPGEDGEPEKQVTYRDYLTELKGTLEDYRQGNRDSVNAWAEEAGLHLTDADFADPEALKRKIDTFTAGRELYSDQVAAANREATETWAREAGLRLTDADFADPEALKRKMDAFTAGQELHYDQVAPERATTSNLELVVAANPQLYVRNDDGEYTSVDTAAWLEQSTVKAGRSPNQRRQNEALSRERFVSALRSGAAAGEIVTPANLPPEASIVAPKRFTDVIPQGFREGVGWAVGNTWQISDTTPEGYRKAGAAAIDVATPFSAVAQDIYSRSPGSSGGTLVLPGERPSGLEVAAMPLEVVPGALLARPLRAGAGVLRLPTRAYRAVRYGATYRDPATGMVFKPPTSPGPELTRVRNQFRKGDLEYYELFGGEQGRNVRLDFDTLPPVTRDAPAGYHSLTLDPVGGTSRPYTGFNLERGFHRGDGGLLVPDGPGGPGPGGTATREAAQTFTDARIRAPLPAEAQLTGTVRSPGLPVFPGLPIPGPAGAPAPAVAPTPLPSTTPHPEPNAPDDPDHPPVHAPVPTAPAGEPAPQEEERPGLGKTPLVHPRPWLPAPAGLTVSQPAPPTPISELPPSVAPAEVPTPQTQIQTIPDPVAEPTQQVVTVPGLDQAPVTTPEPSGATLPRFDTRFPAVGPPVRRRVRLRQPESPGARGGRLTNRTVVPAQGGTHPHVVEHETRAIIQTDLQTGEKRVVPVDYRNVESLRVVRRGQASTDGKTTEAGALSITSKGGRVHAVSSPALSDSQRPVVTRKQPVPGSGNKQQVRPKGWTYQQPPPPKHNSRRRRGRGKNDDPNRSSGGPTQITVEFDR